MYECPTCNIFHSLKALIVEHMKSHMKKFMCDKCQISFRSKQLLKQHEKTTKHRINVKSVEWGKRPHNVTPEAWVKVMETIEKRDFCGAIVKNGKVNKVFN